MERFFTGEIMQFFVLNKKWKMVVRTDKAHDLRFPNSHGVAVFEDKKIHIRKSSLDMVTILHEMLHAYKFELSFYELELDDDQVDEFHCELWAKHGEQMMDDAKRIIEKYKRKK